MAIVFADPGFAELFTKLFVAPEWRSGALMGSVVATFQDFLQDFERMLEADFYRRLAEAFLEECVAYYLAAALTHMRTVNDDDLAGIRRDVGQLRTFFGGIIKADKVGAQRAPRRGRRSRRFPAQALARAHSPRGRRWTGTASPLPTCVSS